MRRPLGSIIRCLVVGIAVAISVSVPSTRGLADTALRTGTILDSSAVGVKILSCQYHLLNSASENYYLIVAVKFTVSHPATVRFVFTIDGSNRYAVASSSGGPHQKSHKFQLISPAASVVRFTCRADQTK